MKILFDASNLFAPGRGGGGVYNYLVKLLPHLIRQVEAGGDELAFLRLHCRGKAGGHPALSGRELVDFRFPVKLLNRLWLWTGWPDLARRCRGVRVVHSPHFSLPVLSGASKVLTVNDLTYLRHPEYFAASGRSLNDYGYRFLLPANVRRADRIIAISEHTKRDLVEYFQVPPAKIAVIHIGCDQAAPLPQEDLVENLAGFKLAPGEYVYCPAGTLEPRKNLKRTIAAFRAAICGRGVRLVISGVGDRSWLGDAWADDDVRLVRWDTDAQRDALYQGSRFVAYPSLYEGFGMPVIEAMAHGKAVLTSETTSLGEIAAGFAHTLNPEDGEALQHGFTRLLDDGEYRQALEEKGLGRAREFTWERMAAQTCAVYRELA